MPAAGHQWALPFAARSVAVASSKPQQQPERKGVGGGGFMDAGSRSSGGAGFDDDDGLSARREVSSSLKELTVRVERTGGSCSGSAGTDQLPNTPRSKHSATEQRRRSKINDRCVPLAPTVNAETSPYYTQLKCWDNLLMFIFVLIGYNPLRGVRVRRRGGGPAAVRRLRTRPPHLLPPPHSPAQPRRQLVLPLLQLLLGQILLLEEQEAQGYSSDRGSHAGTALHHAAKKGFEQTVNLLLSHGANPFITNDDCNTALELAREKGHVNVVQAIEGQISLFCGWMRENYGPGFLEALAPQMRENFDLFFYKCACFMVFLPINIKKCHWYLAVVNAKIFEVHVLDSMGLELWDRTDLKTTVKGLEIQIKFVLEHNKELNRVKWKNLDVSTWPLIEKIQERMQTDGYMVIYLSNS